jgi:hypothetical protein
MGIFIANIYLFLFTYYNYYIYSMENRISLHGGNITNNHSQGFTQSRWNKNPTRIVKGEKSNGLPAATIYRAGKCQGLYLLSNRYQLL